MPLLPLERTLLETSVPACPERGASEPAGTRPRHTARSLRLRGTRAALVVPSGTDGFTGRDNVPCR